MVEFNLSTDGNMKKDNNSLLKCGAANQVKTFEIYQDEKLITVVSVANIKEALPSIAKFHRLKPEILSFLEV